MKKTVSLLLCLAMLFTLCACAEPIDPGPKAGEETTVFIDSAKRSVNVPKQITRIAPSGAVAQMILMTLCPELLVGLSSTPSEEQKPYFAKEMWDLPAFGQFYGSKANLNMEALIDAEPQIIIDLGDPKKTIAEDMDTVQDQTGIPTVFIQASLDQLPTAYRSLGELTGKREQAEKLASFVEKTLEMAEKNRALIAESDRKTVMFGTGPTGLACNAAGSSQADVIDLVGAVNAIVSEEISNKNGGTEVDLEQVYVCDPDVILLAAGGPYEGLQDGEWAELSAVKSGSCYEIPNVPYSWMSAPPSVNRVLGIWWLGNLLYPEIYDYDMTKVAQEYYDLFWHYTLSEEESARFLARSTNKEKEHR